MLMILRVKLLFGLYARHDWEGIFEVDGKATLADFARAVSGALRFGGERQFEFYIARTPHSRTRVTYDTANWQLYHMAIAGLYPLPAERNLYFLYDYGDSWLFRVARSRQRTGAPNPRVDYPRLIRTTGKRPNQFPALRGLRSD